MKIKTSTLFPLVLLLVMIVAIGISSTFTQWEGWLLPIIVAGFIIILASVQIYREHSTKEQVTAEKKEQVTTENGEEPAGAKGASLGSLVGWVFSLPIAIYLLGFLVAIPVFLLCYLKLRRQSWVVSIAIPAITTGAIYGIFELGLEADLWKGLFFE